jgi:hypothetical protein
MSLTINDYIYNIKYYLVLQPIASFEFLHPDETTYASFNAEVISGSLNINRANGVRRSCSLNVHNIYNTFTPSLLRLWKGQKFKLYLGYRINGEDYFIQQGVFVLRSPETIHEPSRKEATITGIDKFALLDGQLGGRLDATYGIDVDTRVNLAMSSILALPAINDPIMPLLSINDSELTPYTYYKELGGTYGDVLLELNKMLAFNMHYDRQGRLLCYEDGLNSEKGSQWDFNTSSNTEILTNRLLSVSRKYNLDNIFNIVKVVGDNINGNLATGEARNNDPTSPFSIVNIGEHLAPIIFDTLIDTDEKAQARAEYELKRYLQMGIETTINCIPLFHLDVDNIVTLTDVQEGIDNERLLIHSISVSFSPQGNNLMSLSCVNSTDFDIDLL